MQRDAQLTQLASRLEKRPVRFFSFIETVRTSPPNQQGQPQAILSADSRRGSLVRCKSSDSNKNPIGTEDRLTSKAG